MSNLVDVIVLYSKLTKTEKELFKMVINSNQEIQQTTPNITSHINSVDLLKNLIKSQHKEEDFRKKSIEKEFERIFPFNPTLSVRG